MHYGHPWGGYNNFEVTFIQQTSLLECYSVHLQKSRYCRSKDVVLWSYSTKLKFQMTCVRLTSLKTSSLWCFDIHMNSTADEGCSHMRHSHAPSAQLFHCHVYEHMRQMEIFDLPPLARAIKTKIFGVRISILSIEFIFATDVSNKFMYLDTQRISYRHECWCINRCLSLERPTTNGVKVETASLWALHYNA